MKILVLSNLWPHPFHTTHAANVVIFELIREFARQKGFKIGFLKLKHPQDSKEIRSQDKEGIDNLKKEGVKILEPLNLPPLYSFSKFRKVFKILKPKLEDFYPEIEYRRIIEKRVCEFSPDIIFIPWSEWITAACSEIKVPKFAYYGNPDPKVGLFRLKFSFEHGDINLMKFLLLRRMFQKFEGIHLEEMKKYEILGDVAVNDAKYYVVKGHPNAFYIRNLWINRFGREWQERKRNLEKESPAIIIGSIGKLNGTANQYGLEILGKDFLPLLRKKARGFNYEIHIFGAGKMHPSLEKYFQTPEVKIRGFVEDIDKEIFSAKVFLCLNNASPYKVGHTRYLHAWSLGACIVAHKDARLSMPEIIHQKNALLGKDIEEIVDLVIQAISDSNLRFKIGEAGYQTFKECFTAEKVVSKIIKKIEEFFKK